MVNKPLVSIIMPVYNGSDFLAEAIDSALSQSYQNIEIIVVNDGSNDNGLTEEIALSYGDKIRYFSKENGGVATALNYAISQMKGEYFSWLSHDDLYLKNKIEREMEEIEKSNDKMLIVFSNYYVNNMIEDFFVACHMESNYSKKSLENSFFPVFTGTIAGCTLLFHKDHFNRIGRLFDESLPTTQDYDLWYDLFRDQNITFITEPLMTVRCHRHQGSRVLPWLEEREKMYMKFMDQITDKEKINVFGSAYDYLVLMLKNYKLWGVENCLNRAKKEFINLTHDLHRPEDLEKSIKKVYSSFPDMPKNLYIFGSGQYGIRVLNKLRIRGIQVNGFIDNNSDKEGTYIEDVRCYILDEDISKDSGIILAIKKNETVIKQLHDNGYNNVVMYDVLENLLENTPIDDNLFLKVICGDEKIPENEGLLKTSVIIPVYNMEEYVSECIESVLAQTQKELEIILVNDGSTDRSEQILREYEKKYNNIHVITQENKKLGAARNAGLSVASGEFIYFLDADDKIEPEALEHCWKECVTNNLDIVFFDRRDIYDENIPEGQRASLASNPIHDNNIYTGKKLWDIYREKILTSSNFSYYRRSFLQDNGIRFMEGVFYEDGEYLFRSIMAAGRVKALPDCFYLRKYHAGSIMTSPMDQYKLDCCIAAMEQIISDGKSIKIDRVTRLYIYKELLAFISMIFNAWGEVTKLKLQRKYLDKLKCINQKVVDVMKLYPADSPQDALELWTLWRDIKQVIDRENTFVNDMIHTYKDLFLGNIRRILISIPLNTKGRVGIYGIGRHTEEFLRVYESLVGDIQADIVFIDEKATNGVLAKFGYKVIAPGSICDEGVENVLISSYNYENEIVDQLFKQYGDKIKIWRFYDVNNINLFSKKLRNIYFD